MMASKLWLLIVEKEASVTSVPKRAAEMKLAPARPAHLCRTTDWP